MLQGYLEELRKTSLLETEEELELWRRDAAGDEAAHQRLMTAYQPLVLKLRRASGCLRPIQWS